MRAILLVLLFPLALTPQQTADLSGPTPNAYLNAIENFNPNRNADVFRWIPAGICYDLIDPIGETVPIADNTSGYNTQQCFNALQPDVRSIIAFRDRLIQQTPIISNPQILE